MKPKMRWVQVPDKEPTEQRFRIELAQALSEVEALVSLAERRGFLMRSDIGRSMLTAGEFRKPKELAERCGVSVDTIKRLVQRRLLPHYRVPTALDPKQQMILIYVPDLEALLERCRVSADEEVLRMFESGDVSAVLRRVG